MTLRITPGVKPCLRLDTPFRESKSLIRTLEGHTGWVNACAFSPDGRFIASASFDKTIRIWETNGGQYLRFLEGHTGWVNACAFSPDGHFIISGSNDKTLRLWDAMTGISC